MGKKYIYSNSDMPKEGWFKGCYLCSTITCKIMKTDIIDDDNTHHSENHSNIRYIYLCSTCQNKYHKHASLREYLMKKWTKYIYNNEETILKPSGSRSPRTSLRNSQIINMLNQFNCKWRKIRGTYLYKTLISIHSLKL